jgi:hypothetical protein
MIEIFRAHRLRTGKSTLLSFEVDAEYQLPLGDLFKKGKELGDFYELTIKLPGKKRSTGPQSMNHHLGGHITQLAVLFETNYNTMKTYIKIRAAAEMGYPCVDIGEIPIPKSEADSTPEECAMLIEMCHIVASERGISLKEE